MFTADGFEVPIDRFAETKFFEAEKIKFARDDAVGIGDELLCVLGPTRFERGRGFFGRLKASEEGWSGTKTEVFA